MKVRRLRQGRGAHAQLRVLAGRSDQAAEGQERDDDDEDEDEPQTVLVDAAPRKALPGRRRGRSVPRSSTGTVPNVPRRKDE